jgi:hypothetical protein
MRAIIVTAIFSGFFATSCGTSIGVTPLNTSPRPLQARAPGDVEVFTTSAPPYSYVDVAYLEAEQSSEMSSDDMPEFIAKLRVRAAEIGCDGLILGGQTNRETVSWSDVTHDVADALSKKPLETPENYGQPVNLRGLTATCIVYREAVAVASAPSAVAPAASSAVVAAYEACRQQRIEIMKRAAQIKNLPERGRMFRTMPSCGERPAS